MGKHEIRNPKQIRIGKTGKLPPIFRLPYSDFELVSDFGFRISDLQP